MNTSKVKCYTFFCFYCDYWTIRTNCYFVSVFASNEPVLCSLVLNSDYIFFVFTINNTVTIDVVFTVYTPLRNCVLFCEVVFCTFECEYTVCTFNSSKLLVDAVSSCFVDCTASVFVVDVVVRTFNIFVNTSEVCTVFKCLTILCLAVNWLNVFDRVTSSFHSELCENLAANYVRHSQAYKAKHVLRCETRERSRNLSFCQAAHVCCLVVQEASEVTLCSFVIFCDTISNSRNVCPELYTLVKFECTSISFSHY